jgi:hypothetical protein
VRLTPSERSPGSTPWLERRNGSVSIGALSLGGSRTRSVMSTPLWPFKSPCRTCLCLGRLTLGPTRVGLATRPESIRRA